MAACSWHPFIQEQVLHFTLKLLRKYFCLLIGKEFTRKLEFVGNMKSHTELQEAFC